MRGSNQFIYFNTKLSYPVLNYRHDNDRFLPRTPSEIFRLNRQIVKRMQKIFHQRGIPVVPSLGKSLVLIAKAVQLAFLISFSTGNNDIWRASLSFNK